MFVAEEELERIYYSGDGDEPFEPSDDEHESVDLAGEDEND